jgi:hypothetical protein
MKKQKNVKTKNKKIIEHINDLFWEYDRMSSSGQESLNKLAEIIKKEQTGISSSCVITLKDLINPKEKE